MFLPSSISIPSSDSSCFKKSSIVLRTPSYKDIRTLTSHPKSQFKDFLPPSIPVSGGYVNLYYSHSLKATTSAPQAYVYSIIWNTTCIGYIYLRTITEGVWNLTYQKLETPTFEQDLTLCIYEICSLCFTKLKAKKLISELTVPIYSDIFPLLNVGFSHYNTMYTTSKYMPYKTTVTYYLSLNISSWSSQEYVTNPKLEQDNNSLFSYVI